MAKHARELAKWGGPDCKRTLAQMEGILSELKRRNSDGRPVVDFPQVLLGKRFGLSAVTMRRRLQDAITHMGRNDDAARFVELWNCISDELATKVKTTITTIAGDATHQKSFDAARWMLDRINRDAVSIEGQFAKTQRGTTVAEVDDEVWDEMTAEEELQLAEIETNIDGEMVKLRHLVRRIEKRIADQRADESLEEYGD